MTNNLDGFVITLFQGFMDGFNIFYPVFKEFTAITDENVELSWAGGTDIE